ncbi:ABC transporter substrate-binding protein [Dolichospermum planctonicum]|uniref:Extracellular ligand-binding receptor n=1 Tax=Dolichospermum planctonicum TaxID=136072 RepID=A0A480AGL4_9CYAN|nr:ABC transporter substrate-binding protein [Dolichospermum planctonicum]GCL42833.1 extracellular ligand-binding receptor [Dolichospermum planctonicum]
MINPQQQRNPYIIGSVIDKPDQFFGRQSLFEFIKDTLEQNTPLILLYGQRRIGKSSVLKQIPQKISEDQFVFIDFDLQVFVGDNRKHPINQILHYLAQRIGEEIGNSLTPTAEDIEDDPTIFHEDFLTQIYNILGEKKLVLLLDEFDVLSEENNEGNVEFFRLINNWLSKWTERLFIIPVVGRHLKELPHLLSLLGGSPYKEISFLDKDSAVMLITRPARGVVTYQPNAIEEILSLSAGHPYFTQLICHELFNLARERQIWTINAEDVKTIIDKAIETGEPGLAWFWNGLYPQAKVVFSAAAEAQHREEQDDQVSYSPKLLLRNYGILTDSLTQVAKEMADYGFLNEFKRVKIELVRLWLLQKHQLKDEISNLAEVNQQDVENLCSVAQNQPQIALQLYEEALGINPNNFQTVTSLAKEYLQVEKFDQAFELYSRAYKFYSINDQQERVLQPVFDLVTEYSQASNLDKALELYAQARKIAPEERKDGFIQTLEQYAHNLTINEDFARARKQYEQVLQIDPNRQLSQDRLEEIRAFESKLKGVENLNSQPQIIANQTTVLKGVETLSSQPQIIANQTTVKPNPFTTVKPNPFTQIMKRPVTFVALATVVSVFGFGIYQQLSRTCPPGEKKELGVFCVVDNSKISRGERTLFPNNNNPSRDQGIAAFKNGNYQAAAKLFQQSIEAKQKDPELVIYYNNARARQQGSPFTLAVVVPIVQGTQINDAQEILRGVAQAQNQFNDNQGLNNRFLEIVIANDDNKESTQQLAQQLVKDNSILGVIGHNSSDATQAALPEYEKAGLAIISPTATSVFLKRSVFFRTVISDASAGKKLAEYTFNNLKLKRAVIFANPNSPYSNSIREVFTNRFEKLGGEVVRKPLIDLTDINFDARREISATVYSRDKFAQAAMLFPDTQSTPTAINIAKEITRRNARLKDNPQDGRVKELKMLGGDSLYSDKTSKNVEGLIVATPWFRESSPARPFAERSEQEWGGGISWRTATSFDATQAFIKALSNNVTRTNLLEKLPSIKLDRNETSGYQLKFTEEREREGQSILVQVKDGKFVPIELNGL